MRVELQKPTDIQAQLDIQIAGSELADYITKAYKSISNQVNIRGFRPGKAPKSVIDSAIGKDMILEQAIADSIDDFYQKALKEKNITPLGKPEAEIVEKPNPKNLEGILKIIITVDTKPTITLPEYKGMTVQLMEKYDEEEMLNERLASLQKKFATLSDPIEKQVEKGDFAVINLSAKIGNSVVESVSNTTYEVGSNSLLDGLDDAIYTLTPGEDAIFNSTLVGGSHAGQEAEITVEVLKICNLNLPELNNEFAKTNTGYKTLDELKTHLKTNIQSAILLNQFNEATKRALDLLLEKSDTILIPDSLLSMQADETNEDGKSAPHLQLPQEKTEDLKDYYRKQFLLDAIAEKDKIKLTTDDINQYIQDMASIYGVDSRVIADSFARNNSAAYLHTEALRRKATNALVASLRIKDPSGGMINFDKLFSNQEK